MRIVAGTLRGRKLGSPVEGVRPTSDRVRESLFSRLGDLSGESVLDLFAGTGALGIEAISRGAECLVSVDHSRKAIAAMEQTFEQFGLASEARTLHLTALAAIRRLSGEGQLFSLVFLDPPYAEGSALEEALAALRDSGLLAPGAILVVETPRRNPLAWPIPGFELEEARRYGDTVISWIYALTENENEEEQ